VNATNKDYFTFNAHNSMLLLGQSGSGKSTLIHTLLKRYESSLSANNLKYIIIDFKQVEYVIEGKDYKRSNLYVDHIVIDPHEALDVLEEVSHSIKDRTMESPLLFIVIEECDAAVTNQDRFDEYFMKITENAAKSNVKIIYTTSRFTLNTVSERLRNSVDLTLVGNLIASDCELLGIKSNTQRQPYEFVVLEASRDT